MGNTTNPTRWDARRRLEFIELAAFWRGWIQRSDLANEFGQSLPQASSDLQAYMEINPDGLHYDLNAKRYFGAADMELKLARIDLADAVAKFLGSEGKSLITGDKIASIDLPFRAIPPAVARDVFRAIAQSRALEINYLSINGNTEGWRWITPRAFAHDGYRWHVRAYCHRDEAYKDFVIGRMSKTRPPVEQEKPRFDDHDWNTWETIRLKPHSKLTDIQRRAIEQDFEMRRGAVTLKVRKSMKNYTLSYLRLIKPIGFPELLELGDNEPS
ncbi:MAG: WYL domain-containing protein [Opitutaceae bacterium]|nr:WYL domain-containing protein [Cephaloticoccus sp.]MCP5530396.1 WYL domain-containing protein [Opitutaceae bacterium]